MNLNELMALAYAAHEGQTDKSGKPYILHPMRVALNVFGKAVELEVFRGIPKATFQLAVKACIGHDLIEDTAVTLDDLRDKGLEEDVVLAIEHLTKVKGETYPDFIRRCMENQIAAIAKVCDIVDNSDVSRIPPELRTPKDAARAAKYRLALLQLGVKEQELQWLLVYE
ncbi:GTP pyrophosphokinase [Paenibacillus albidus]|uniref:GTP pyrophosphokinase n=1 Tax=Paenibacillus albidus TaxID=2041023 RepID=UPI001BE67175|nr:GTP pyrophosphokinase [Paenibacillus albidus]MBT2291117.1 GTP pyrophosphokinase [Paenibacillus albidus]